jgi:hypothetical protein
VLSSGVFHLSRGGSRSAAQMDFSEPNAAASRWKPVVIIAEKFRPGEPILNGFLLKKEGFVI